MDFNIDAAMRDVDRLIDENEQLRNDNAGLIKGLKAAEKICELRTSALVEIREIYAGMDGFIPETAPEGYQQRIIKQMYEAAIHGLST